MKAFESIKQIFSNLP